MNCIFCKIVKGEAEANIVHETEDCLIFHPLNPVALGHVLVIPKIHVNDALQNPLITGITMARASEYADWQGAHGYNLITSVGEVATQSIFHLHVHIVPRRPDDGLKLPWTEEV